MTIEEASMYGLFHPRCDHIPEQLELAPQDSGKDGVINLNDANSKRYEYNIKSDKSHFLTKNLPQKTVVDKLGKVEYGTLEELNNIGAKYAKEVLKQLPNGTKTERINYARKTFAETTRQSYFNVGNMTDEAKNILGSKTNSLWFSVDNMIKNKIAHPEISFGEYKMIADIIKTPSKIAKSKDDIILFKVQDKYYMIAIKTTVDKTENYIKSFRRLGQNEYEKY